MHVSVHVGLRGNEANCVPRCEYVFCTHAHTHTPQEMGFFFFLEIKQVDKTLQSQLFTTWASKCDQYMTITNNNINEAKIKCMHSLMQSCYIIIQGW